MHSTSLFDAKTHLSRIIAELVDGVETEVQICRRGKPVARLLPIKPADTSRRIGCAKGKVRIPADIDSLNPSILKLFVGDGADESAT